MIFAKIDLKVPNPDTSDPDNKYVNEGTYLLYYGTGARETAEAVFGASLREGVTYSKTKISRREIVPLIQDYLSTLPTNINRRCFACQNVKPMAPFTSQLLMRIFVSS